MGVPSDAWFCMAVLSLLGACRYLLELQPRLSTLQTAALRWARIMPSLQKLEEKPSVDLCSPTPTVITRKPCSTKASVCVHHGSFTKPKKALQPSPYSTPSISSIPILSTPRPRGLQISVSGLRDAKPGVTGFDFPDATPKRRQHFSKQQTSQVSGVWKLPFELLSLIFSASLRDNNHSNFNWRDVHAHAQTKGLIITDAEVLAPILTLAQVCTRWRSVAFSIPSLWSFIAVDLSCPCAGIETLVRLYVERSGPKKLTVVLQCDSDAHGTTIDDRNCFILECLFAESARWERVAFNFNDRTFDALSSHLNDKYDIRNNEICTDAVKSLNIEWTTCYGVDPSNPIFSQLFSVSSSLRSLQLEYFDRSFRFPLYLLTDVTIKKDSTGSVLELLQQCPNLRTASVPCEAIRTIPYRAHRQEIVLHSLESLTIEPFGCFVKATEVFSALVLPNLRSLKLYNSCVHAETMKDNSTSSRWIQEFEAFLQRSSYDRGLESLNLHGFQFNDLGLLRVLSLTPNLETLTIDAAGVYEFIFTTRFFEGLAQPGLLKLMNDRRSASSIPALLPRLKNLSLRFYEFTMQRDDLDLLIDRLNHPFHSRRKLFPDLNLLFSMVESRSSAPPSLPSCSFNEGHNPVRGSLTKFEFRVYIPIPEERIAAGCFKDAQAWKNNLKDEDGEIGKRIRALATGDGHRGLEICVDVEG